MEKAKLKIVQISDVHLKHYRNLLEPLVKHINNEDFNLVVVTGDLVHEHDKDLFKLAADTLNKIKHRVVVIPGEYDDCDLWDIYFGKRYKSIEVADYILDFIDTSYMRTQFTVGWADTLEQEDKSQHDWLMEKLNNPKYHIIFSHHPYVVSERSNCKEKYFANDNIRAFYAGHYHEPMLFNFDYKKEETFGKGIGLVPLKFHGNAGYNIIVVKENNEIINIPRIVINKITAW